MGKQLYNCFESQSISIFDIIDHENAPNDTDDHNVYNHMHLGVFITSSACMDNINAAIGGVSLMVNKNAANVLFEVIKWNETIKIATFDGDPKTKIIVYYLLREHYN